MKLKVRLAGLGLVAAMLLAFVIVPAANAAPATPAHPTARPTVTMSGPIAPTPAKYNGVAGTFMGTAQVTHIDAVGKQLVASGVVNGTFTSTSTDGTVTHTFSNLPFSGVPLDPPASCTILNLTLGPINLNLLGLVVQTNMIHLTITAVPGPGNLLGNLLCAVANLLNGTGTGGGLSTAIQNLLNQINAILAGL